MSNGDKKRFIEQVKLFIKICFSDELMKELVTEMQDEYEQEQSRRDAAKQEKKNGCQGDPCFNES